MLTRQATSTGPATAATARARRNLRTQLPGRNYDAFISYSHEADIGLAALLQAGLQKYARPWNRFSALRVFRDKSSLPATPDLRAGIEKALSKSEWFVLMASEEAARSDWVKKEIDWWLDHKSADRLLIVLTFGEIEWDGQDFDWRHTTALPGELRGKIKKEPLWVDATWARSAGQLTEDNPALEENVISVAAAIRGITRDQLVELGDREYRRTKRVARLARISLATLLVLTVTAAVTAFWQRNNAVRQARVALSRQLAATSENALSTNLDMALLLAVQAYQTDPNAQTRAALMRADTASPQLVRYVQTGGSISRLAASGSTVVAGLTDGRVLRWTLADPRPRLAFTMTAAITSLAVSRDGTVIAASDGSGARLWRQGHAVADLSVPAGQTADVVALSPSGRTAVVHGAAPVGGGAESIVVFDVPRMAVASVHGEPETALAGTNYIVVPSDDQVVLFDLGYGAWERRTIPGWSLRGQGDAALGVQQSPGIPAADGGFFTATNESGTVPVWQTRGKTHPFHPGYTAQVPLSGIGSPSASALSPDGTKLAVIDSGVIYVAPVSRAGQPKPAALPLTGDSNASSVMFAGNDNELISASGTTVAQWNLTQLGRVARGVPSTIALSCDACLGPSVTISPDSTMAGIVSGDASQAAIQPLPPTGGGMMRAPGDPFDVQYGPLVWGAGNRLVVPVSPPNGGSNVVPPDSSPLYSVWAGGDGTDPVMADGMAGTSTRSVIVVDSRGNIYWQDVATGKTQKTIPGPADLEFGDASLQGAAVSSSAELVAMIDNGTVRVVDPADGHTVGRIPGSTASWVTFSGSHLLVQRKDGSLDVWNARGTALERTLPAEQTYGPPVGNKRGTLIARPQSNGSIELDDLDSGAVVDTLPPVSTASWAKPGVAFTPDGNHLIIVTSGVGSAAESAELVDVDISDRALVRAACAAADGALSPPEWRAFAGGDPPANLACQEKRS